MGGCYSLEENSWMVVHHFWPISQNQGIDGQLEMDKWCNGAEILLCPRI